MDNEEVKIDQRGNESPIKINIVRDSQGSNKIIDD